MTRELRPRKTALSQVAKDDEPATHKAPPKPTKRKAIEDDSPAATKKQKSVKTPSRAKDTKKAVTDVVEEEPAAVTPAAKTPAAKSSAATTLTAKTPTAKSSAATTPTAKTPVTKSATAKTPVRSAKSPAVKTPVAKPASAKTPVKKAPTVKSPAAKPSAVKPAAAPVSEAQTPATKPTPAKGKKSKKGERAQAVKAEMKVEVVEEIVEGVVEEDDHPFSDEEVDEQTKSLVQAIDGGDEEQVPKEADAFKKGQDVGEVPKISKKEKMVLKAAASATKEESGVIYIGRLPHGFYEHELKSYFSQFGPISNLRLSRNKKTGQSKHFAFIEFEELSTAEIVAKTMDHYLLFGHILRCSVIPKAQVHENMFKGANRRFKSIPWNKMEGKVMERPQLESKWGKKIAQEEKKRAARAEKLKALGYDFNAPTLMSAVAATKAAAAAKAVAASVDSQDDVPKAIEAPAAAPVEEAAATEVADIEMVDKKEEEQVTPKPVKKTRAKTPKSEKKVGRPRKTKA